VITQRDLDLIGPRPGPEDDRPDAVPVPDGPQDGAPGASAVDAARPDPAVADDPPRRGDQRRARTRVVKAPTCTRSPARSGTTVSRAIGSSP
jgi:hypothetical protein